MTACLTLLIKSSHVLFVLLKGSNILEQSLHSCILGTGSATPEMILTNQELEGIVDTSDEWITRRTGIKERRIALKDRAEKTEDLGREASLKAMEMAGVPASKIDMIVIGTVTPDLLFPSAGCMIQKAINATNAIGFDVSAGCSGFLYALSMADNAIRTGMSKYSLVLGVERLSSILDWQDRGTCVLMGDGAGAVLLGAGESNNGGILSTHLKSDGKLWEFLYASEGNDFLPDSLQSVRQRPFQIRMDGNPLFKRAVTRLSSIAKEALEKNNLTNEDIQLFIPHQANIRIIQAMAKNLKIPMEKVYTNIEKYGNTSSASVPIALDEANRKGLIRKDDNLLLVAFGAGLTWGSSVISWTI